MEVQDMADGAHLLSLLVGCNLRGKRDMYALVPHQSVYLPACVPLPMHAHAHVSMSCDLHLNVFLLLCVSLECFMVIFCICCECCIAQNCEDLLNSVFKELCDKVWNPSSCIVMFMSIRDWQLAFPLVCLSEQWD